MAPQPNSSVKLELLIPTDHPELLAGLDLWLQLGLLSDRQVRRIARSSLVCPLPEPTIASAAENFTSLEVEPAIAVPDRQERPARRARRQSAPLVPRVLQALMAEISVIWLLFLGVFMVVVSSGVLAATQWQNFSPVGQYAILFGYTLAFWLAASWMKRQSNLQLTSRMLQITTLLIIPVNFWVIDSFRLWQMGLSSIAAAISGVVLSAIIWLLLRSSPRRILVNSLGVSWLQLGWTLPGFPLLTTYIGTIGTAILQLREADNPEQTAESAPRNNQATIGLIAIAFATLLLVGRAVFAAGVPLQQLGLALGVCGWLLVWLARSHRRPLWTSTGFGLLLLGWAVSVSVDPPWQAIIVSGLGLWLLLDRLYRRWQGTDLLALFLVGLQAYCLLWRLLPLDWRSSLLAFTLPLAGQGAIAWELLGLGLFPYLGLTLLGAAWLRRRQQPTLANQAEQLALTLGILLAVLSGWRPLVRSLYLLLSTLALVAVLRQRRPAGAWLVYFTHATGLLALFSWISWAFPGLDDRAWAGVLLATMAIEWGLSLLMRSQIWRQTSWHLGLVLAVASFALLYNSADLDANWALSWLLAPAALTGLSRRPTFPQPQLASGLSAGGLALAQFLTLEATTPLWIASGEVTPFLLSLGVATVLMLINTQRLPHPLTSALTVGFGFGCASAVAWQFFRDRIDLTTWLAIGLWLLWLLYTWAIRQPSRLAELYAAALNGWAIGVSLVNLVILTADVGLELLQFQPLGWQLFWAALITTAAIGFRVAQRPTNLGFYGLAWGAELIVAATIILTKASWDTFAIVNLALGLLTQIMGDVWVSRSPEQNYRSSWHAIPILFAALGVGVAHHTFTATTGLYTLAAALTGIGVGRRRSNLKPFTYLAIVGVSIAAYELLIYQLMQVSGGSAGDGIVLLAGLAALIAIGYRLSASLLTTYWRLTLPELQSITHLHWAAGSGLAVLAGLSSLSDTGRWIWIGVMAGLAAYAIWQGRSRNGWVYAGVVEAIAALGYLLDQLLPTAVWVAWAGAIASGIALVLYSLPWQTWGWPNQPWKRSAFLLPIVIVLLTGWEINLPSLLIVAAFYAWLAKTEAQIRLSYFSLFLADWAILRQFAEWDVSEPLWYMAVVSGSLLYVAQFDPGLQTTSARERRHLLRSLAIGLFCLTAFYQSASSLLPGLLTAGLGVGLILVGLVLRVRAFLYVGTLTFVIQVLRLLWLFINNYSLLLWGLGILLGLLFIWIAATFEARRSQTIALMQYWVNELEAWE